MLLNILSNALNSITMAQLAACIVESKLVYQLNKLKDLYCSIMRDLGKPVDSNSIRFKEKLLLIGPDLVESSAGQGRGHSTMICCRETAAAPIQAELYGR